VTVSSETFVSASVGAPMSTIEAHPAPADCQVGAAQRMMQLAREVEHAGHFARDTLPGDAPIFKQANQFRDCVPTLQEQITGLLGQVHELTNTNGALTAATTTLQAKLNEMRAEKQSLQQEVLMLSERLILQQAQQASQQQQVNQTLQSMQQQLREHHQHLQHFHQLAASGHATAEGHAQSDPATANGNGISVNNGHLQPYSHSQQSSPLQQPQPAQQPAQQLSQPAADYPPQQLATSQMCWAASRSAPQAQAIAVQAPHFLPNGMPPSSAAVRSQCGVSPGAVVGVPFAPMGQSPPLPGGRPSLSVGMSPLTSAVPRVEEPSKSGGRGSHARQQQQQQQPQQQQQQQ